MVQRTRNRGALQPTLSGGEAYNLASGPQPDTRVWVNLSVGRVESMTDYVTAGFRQKQAKGGIVNTPMRQSADERSFVGGGMVSTAVLGSSKGTTRNFSGNCFARYWGFPTPKTDEGVIASLRTAVATNARASVEDPAVQGQVFLLELKKTLQMLRKPFSGLTAFIEAYLKRRRNPRYRGGPAVVPTVAGCWLEYRYGWRPFLLEAEAILETLFAKDKLASRKTARAMLQRTVTSTVRTTNELNVATGYSADFTYEYRTDYIVRSGLLYEARASLEGQFGMRWADMPSTVWEVIPFSFVVDWFVNVGKLISALTPKAGVNVLAEFESVAVKATVTRTCSRVSGSSAWVFTPVQGSQTRILETYERVPKVSSPGFAFAFSLSDALRGLRVLDALGLLIQLLTGSKSARR